MRAFIVLLLAAVATAKMAPLLKAKEPITGRYIVKLQDGVDIDSIASTVGIAGGRVGHLYKTALKGFAVELTSDVLELVRQLPGVEYVEEDGVARAMQSVASWGLDRIDQANLPLDDNYSPRGDGAGTTVYVIDTGINYNHVDFYGRAQNSWSYTSVRPDDCNGHGTHCAGTVGSYTYGVAKNVQLRAVKVLNCFGSGSWSDTIAACEWITNNAEKPAVASMSLGGGYTQTVNDAVEAMIASGIPTAIAAGNSNDDACYYSPASAPNAITVGSTDSDDYRSSFSNYGSCVDIFAPGRDITSTWHTSNTATNTISGTSMACPHVAGAIAIYGGNTAEMLSAATPNVVESPGSGSPNLMLRV